MRKMPQKMAQLINLLVTIGLRGISALSLFFVFSLVSKVYQQVIAGEFFYYYTLVTISSVILLFGLQPMIVRESAKLKNGLNRKNLEKIALEFLTSARISGPLAITFIIIFSIASGLSFSFALYIFISSVAMASLLIMSATFQSVTKFNVSIVVGNLLAPLFFMFLISALSLTNMHPIYLFTSSLTVAAVTSVLLTYYKSLNAGDAVECFSTRERLSFLSINLNTLFFNWGSVLIVGLLASAEIVAQVSIAQRVGGIVAFFLFFSNSILAPKISLLYSDGKLEELIRVTALTNRIVFATALMISGILLFDEAILILFFGKGVTEYISVIQIICLAHLINAFFGNCTVILSMCGFQKELNFAMSCAAVVNLCCGFIVIYFFDAVGAAYSFLVAMIILNGLCLLSIRRNLGFWILGGWAVKRF